MTCQPDESICPRHNTCQRVSDDRKRRLMPDTIWSGRCTSMGVQRYSPLSLDSDGSRPRTPEGHKNGPGAIRELTGELGEWALPATLAAPLLLYILPPGESIHPPPLLAAALKYDSRRTKTGDFNAKISNNFGGGATRSLLLPGSSHPVPE